MPHHPIEEQAIFLTARRISDLDERKGFIERCCGSDSDLFSRVMSLLRVDCEEPEFLKQPVVRSALSALYLRVGPKQGDSVGPYVLTEPLGTGGMGIVWLAEQRAPIRRQVAIKIMNTGFGTEVDLQRFDSERQLLAMMDHPGIVKLHDAGNTADGRPWFAMEFVIGQRITDYCNQRQLSLRERLKLFTDVCESVEHAHQRGVVHRDLKPGNILISEVQGRPVSRLIDFGLSFSMILSVRETDQRQAPIKVAQGTPAYMSPEAAGFESGDVDHRTDIYSLGALLYELISGVPPYFDHEWEQASPAERMRMIKEKSPLPLFDRVHKNGGTSIPAMNGRSVDVKSVRRTLFSFRDNAVLRDLSLIVQTACEREPSNRYQRVQQFAEDLRRCLEHRPLLTTLRELIHEESSATEDRRSKVVHVPLSKSSGRRIDSIQKWILRNLGLNSGLMIGIATAASLSALVVSSWMVTNRGSESNSDLDPPGEQFPMGEVSNQNIITDASRLASENESNGHVEPIREAHFLMQQGEIEALNSRLQTLRESHRGNGDESRSNDGYLTFEERYLEALSDSRARVYQVHSGKVFDIRFTPDGSRIISCGGTEAEYRTKVLDYPSGNVLSSISNAANSCWVRKSDGAVLTAEDLGWVSAWDLAQTEPQELFRVEGFELPVGKVWLSSDGELMLVTEFEWQFKRFRTSAWKLTTREMIHVLDGERIIGVHEPDGQVVTASEQSVVAIRTLHDFSISKQLQTQLEHVKSGDVSSLGHIAVGDRQGAIWLWNGKGTGQKLIPEGAGVAPARDVVFVPDGSLLISAFDDGIVRLWDVTSGEVLRTLQHKGVEAWSLDVSPDGESFAVGLSDGTVRVYDLKRMEMGFGRQAVLPYSIHKGGFTTDGTHVVIPGTRSNEAEFVRVRDCKTILTVIADLKDSNEAIEHYRSVASPDGDDIVLTSDKGRIYVASSGASKAVLRVDTGLGKKIHSPTISQDGNWVCICRSQQASDDPEPPGSIWNFRTGTKAFDLPCLADELSIHPHGIVTFSLGATGRILSIQGRTAAVWSADSIDQAFELEPERIVTLPRWLGAADLNGQGAVLLSTEDEGIYLWDTKMAGSKPRLLSRRLPLNSLAVSPDGTTLATGSVEGELLLWSLPSAEPLFSLPGASGPISHLHFTADGKGLNAITETSRQTGEILYWGSLK